MSDQKLSSSNFNIRAMVKEDIEQLGAIELDAFPELFPPTSFKREYENSNSNVLVAELDINITRTIASEKDLAKSNYRKGYTGWHLGDRFIVGMLINWCMAGENHIISIGVRRDYRRIGIGKLLLLSLMEMASNNSNSIVTLEVRKSNLVAITLYQKLGFEIVGTRKNYYFDNREDALIMTLSDARENTPRAENM